MHTDIHALCGIRTHDPSVRVCEDMSCLRPRDHCDQLFLSKNVEKPVQVPNRTSKLPILIGQSFSRFCLLLQPVRRVRRDLQHLITLTVDIS
jgi:hypothetical protein